MSINKPSKLSARIWVLIIIFVLIAAVGYFTISNALASGGFSTTDGNIDEWEDVEVFLSDNPRDVPDPTEDILEVKIVNTPANGKTKYIFFLMKFAGKPVLQENYRAAIVSIDCDGNGQYDEAHDRMVVYVATKDHNKIMRGDQSEGFYTRSRYGQVVGDYVEWMVPISDLPPDGRDSTRCTGNVKLGFATVDLGEYYETPPGEVWSEAIVIDDIKELVDWNIP